MISSGYDYIEKDFVATDYFIFEGYPEVILEPLDAPLLLKTGCYIWMSLRFSHLCHIHAHWYIFEHEFQNENDESLLETIPN